MELVPFYYVSSIEMYGVLYSYELVQQVHLYTRQARILIDVLKRCVCTGSSIAEEIGFL